MINFLRSILILLVFSAAVYCQEGPVIYVIKIDGSINPSSADFIRKSIEEAKNKKAECLVIQLNTPGG
ncbi:MAG TPA: nodulation protein NfeD, partial [Ignavibacteria bacterium]|nr:nodulation protein NfeD [Ignavibacteria bacterium]